MHIRKAVITAAGRGRRLYPAADTVQKAMLPLVDRDGLAKPVLQIIAEEAFDSGIEELCLVCAPGDEPRYREQFAALRRSLREDYDNATWAVEEADRLDMLMQRVQFVVQEEPRGYGHAVQCAEPFTSGEPFLLLLSDHLYVSRMPGKRCARQVIDLAEQEGCPVAAVHPTREHLIRRYGTLGGRRESNLDGVYRVEKIIEKPSVSEAELELQTPGLRAGHYLCFFGIYVLSPMVFELLAAAPGYEVQLTPALNELSARERHLALEVKGTRYDIGAHLGLFQAQAALGLAGRERDALLRAIIEMLAEERPVEA